MPVNEMFESQERGWLDPNYAPAARDAMLMEEGSTRERDKLSRQWDTEDAANEFMDNAEGRTSDELLSQLTPEILTTPQGAAMHDFIRLKQYEEQAKLQRTRYANASLAPSMALKIKDPVARQQFMQDTEDGMDANDAWMRAEEVQAENDQAMALAEAMVPEEEYDSFRDPNTGKLDRLRVARKVAMQKARSANALSPKELSDIQSELDADPANALAKIALLEEQGINTAGFRIGGETKLKKLTPSLLLRYQQVAQDGQWDEAQKQQASQSLYQSGYDAEPVFGVKRPQPAAPQPEGASQAAQEGAVPPPPVPVEEEIEDPFTYLQRKEAAKAPPKADPEQEQIDTAWSQAKQDIGQRIESQFKQESPKETREVLERAAKSIIAGKKMTANLGIGFSNDQMLEKVPVAYQILSTLGINPDEPAFEEPANKRLGSQKVGWDEVMKAWAADYLDGIQAGDKAEQNAKLAAGEPVTTANKITVRKKVPATTEP